MYLAPILMAASAAKHLDDDSTVDYTLPPDPEPAIEPTIEPEPQSSDESTEEATPSPPKRTSRIVPVASPPNRMRRRAYLQAAQIFDILRDLPEEDCY